MLAPLTIHSEGFANFSITAVSAPLAAPSTYYGTIARTGSFSNSNITNQRSLTAAGVFVRQLVQAYPAPAATTTLTPTSSNPGVALLTTNPSATGTASISFPGIGAGQLFY